MLMLLCINVSQYTCIDEYIYIYIYINTHTYIHIYIAYFFLFCFLYSRSITKTITTITNASKTMTEITEYNANAGKMNSFVSDMEGLDCVYSDDNSEEDKI